jgi:hypothetical protein
MMRKAMLTALTATTLSSGLFVVHAAATPSQLPAPAAPIAHSAWQRQATVLCGNNGCAPVQTKARQRRKFQPLGHG